jgi:hypothetical protein
MAGKCDLPLHGLTVVVDTGRETLYLGRYDFEDAERIVLRDAEVRELHPGETKARALARSAKYGVFKNCDRLEIPRAEVLSVRRLSEIPGDLPMDLPALGESGVEPDTAPGAGADTGPQT